MDFSNLFEDIENEISCLICHEANEELTQLSCLHVFCETCAKETFDKRKKQECPFCKATYTERKKSPIANSIFLLNQKQNKNQAAKRFILSANDGSEFVLSINDVIKNPSLGFYLKQTFDSQTMDQLLEKTNGVVKTKLSPSFITSLLSTKKTLVSKPKKETKVLPIEHKESEDTRKELDTINKDIRKLYQLFLSESRSKESILTKVNDQEDYKEKTFGYSYREKIIVRGRGIINYTLKELLIESNKILKTMDIKFIIKDGWSYKTIKIEIQNYSEKSSLIVFDKEYYVSEIDFLSYDEFLISFDKKCILQWY